MSDTRFCPSCGTQVSAAERFCGNCGTRMDPVAANAAPQIVPPVGVPASEPTQVLPSVTPTPTPAFQSPLGDTPFGAPTPEPPKRKLPVWAIILLVIVGLCAIVCVAGVALTGIFGSTVAQIASTVEAGVTTEAKPTSSGGGIVPVPVPTRENIPTREAAPTREPAPTPEAAPTSGGGGIVNVGGGSEAEQTAEAATAEAASAEAATAEAGQTAGELASILATGKQVFRDEFVDNRNAWFTGVFEEIETDTIEDGVFKVAWTNKGNSYELYEVRELTNFAAEVDCLIRVGGVDASCGIVFAQKNDIGFYKFEVFNDYYRLFIVQPEGDPPIIAEGDPAGIIKPDEVNQLRVVKRGDEIKLYLNGSLLDTLTDSTYQTGKVGVSTNSYVEGAAAEIWFDNFIVWELPN